MKRHSNLLVALTILIVACTPAVPLAATPLAPAPTPNLPIQPPTIVSSLTDVPSPTRTPNPFPNPVLKVTGAEEVVFDWTTGRCEKFNIPDLPSRAFRGADGQVQLILSHTKSYRMVGSDLNHLKIDCSPIFSSEFDPDPSQFNDAEWIAPPYTEDGQTVYAIIHDEYHGWEHPGQCSKYSKTLAYFPCWYNTLTLAVSTDGGKTFTHAANPPGHFLAGLPFPYKADAGPAGPRNPSNIIKGKDGYYYTFTNVSYYADDKQWVCLMRTQNLSNPTSWRFWDGGGFDGQFINPYVTMPDNPDRFVCPALEFNNIGAQLNDSITYNTYLNRYVLTGISADSIGGRLVWGVFYSFSDDLIHWTRRKLLVEMTLPWTAKNNTDVMYLYPALLDPASESRNFETTGKTAYLYYTRHNFGQGSPDRDLVRVAVEFFPSESEFDAREQTPTPITVTSTETGAAAPFAGIWEGVDPLDGSIITLSLQQTGNGLTGTFKDTYSSNIKPPGYEGSSSGTVLSANAAQITFNLTRWDGKTTQATYSLTLSNQNNTLTLNCEVGCPIVLQRK